MPHSDSNPANPANPNSASRLASPDSDAEARIERGHVDDARVSGYRFGLGCSLFAAAVVFGIVQYKLAEDSPRSPERMLPISAAIVGGLGLVVALFFRYSASSADERNFMIEKCTPLPLRLVNEHDDVWLRGQIYCPAPVFAPEFQQPCAMYKYVKKRRETTVDSKGRRKTRWVTIATKAGRARAWLTQEPCRIELDLPNAEIECFKNDSKQYGDIRHELEYLPAAGPIQSTGVVVDAGGDEVDAAEVANVSGVELATNERERTWLAKTIDRREQRDLRRATRIAALTAAPKASAWSFFGLQLGPTHEEQTPPPTPNDAEYVFPVLNKRLLLTKRGHVPLMLTDKPRGAYVKSVEGSEATSRGSADLLSWLGLSLLVFTAAMSYRWFNEIGMNAALSAAAGLVLFVPLHAITSYNQFVAYRIRVANAWAQIDADLKMRWDLLPSLVTTIQAATSHERDVQELVALARTERSRVAAEQRLNLESRVSKELRDVFVLVEKYPELKTQSNFQQLFDTLVALEEKIAFGRAFLNEVVSEYNTVIDQFPAVVWSRPFGFRSMPFWG